MFISLDQLAESENRFSALKEIPARNTVSALWEEALIPDISPALVAGNILRADENLEKRKQMLEVVSQEPLDFAFERAIGKNDSVYSNFVELIGLAKRKVGRIAIKSGSRNIGYATGFMVTPNLLLTNWHVFKTKEEVADSEIQFFYELDIYGNPGEEVAFKLDANRFYHSVKELDYCFVAVAPLDLSGKMSIADIGFLFLDPSLGKLGNEGQEALNIIHHPDGDYKQLSIRENTFEKIAPTSIWYKTDTAPGSSGSPVFNDQWQIVALHHMGVGKKNDAGEYIDQDGVVIPVVNNVIDASRIVWIANEGIRISVILKDFTAGFPDEPLVKELASPQKAPDVEKKEDKSHVLIPESNNKMEPINPDGNVNISFPASLVTRNGVINIQINQGDQVQPPARPDNKVLSADEAIAEEIKQLETSTDFSKCKGYQSAFLGRNLNIALPQPVDALRRFASRLNGSSSIVLKYYNYSTIMHAVRKMPIISAVNVDGDLDKRLDQSERKDKWLRDSRMSFEVQLDDGYYKNSGFDRGHMSRREDANWGATANDAKRNADLTCMYTNACPQVPKINQSSRKGLWGILEKVILEQGAQTENGKTARISVFNGPVFKEDDPVYGGVQVPLNFFKIVLWLSDDGILKATAFSLSQVGLVDNIDWEELDLDQNVEFKPYQCSIASLQEQTNIDFSAIIPYDTFDGLGEEALELTSVDEVTSHIKKYQSKAAAKQ